MPDKFHLFPFERSDLLKKPFVDQINSSPMSSEEMKSLTAYTGSEFSLINHRLRQITKVDAGFLHEQSIRHSLVLWKAILRYQVPEDLILYRGTQINTGYQVDQVFTSPSFISTSIDYGVGYRFSGSGGEIYQFHCPSGHPGFLVKSVSKFRLAEEEIILPPGTRFKVVSRGTVEGYAKTAFKLEILPYEVPKNWEEHLKS